MKETEIHLLGYLWHMILVRDEKKMGRRSSCLFIYLKLYSALQLHEAYIYIYVHAYANFVWLHLLKAEVPYFSYFVV